MKNYKIRTACIVVVLLMAAFAARSAVAQEKGKSLKQPLKLEIKANLVSIVEKNGKKVTELKPADNAERGDVLVYAITYTNEGKAPLKDISVVDPVPKGTVYIIGSADGKDTEIGFSIDGGRVFQKPPIKYIEEKPDGKSEEKEAPADMYTHIKWLIAKTVEPGKSGKVSFKVKVK